MKEKKSCLHPFIRRTKWVYKRGGSLTDAIAEIPTYQERVGSVYQVNVYFLHNLAVSQFSLRTIATYEYLRHCGTPLPGFEKVIEKLLPLKAYSERKLLNETEDLRHTQLEKIYKI